MSRKNWLMMTTCVSYFILLIITLSMSVLHDSTEMLIWSLFIMWILLLTMMGSIVYIDNADNTPKGIVYLLYVLMLPITITEVIFGSLFDLVKYFINKGGDDYEA